jgi:hypothetical protein
MIRVPRSTTARNNNAYTPLPDGTYDFRITEVSESTSSAGNPQLVVRMVCQGPAFADRKATIWLTQTAKAAWKTEQLFEALSIEPEETGDVDEDGNPIYAYNEEELVGRFVSFEVTTREYNGKRNNDFSKPVRASMDPGGYEDAPAKPERAAAPARDAAPPRLQRRPRAPVTQ